MSSPDDSPCPDFTEHVLSETSETNMWFLVTNAFLEHRKDRDGQRVVYIKLNAISCIHVFAI